MKPILIMALAEIREGLRNRWIAVAIAGLSVFAFSLALLGSAPVGEIKASALDITTVSLASLSVYLIPLIALLMAFDSIVGEAEHGTLLLLLTYPIQRWQVLSGKFLGHIIILSLSIIIGYGLGGLYISFNHATGVNDWLNFARMIASTLLLGCIFLSIGYLLSVLVKQRATAIGACVAVWVLMIVVYDFILLGLVLTDSEQTLKGEFLAVLIYLNPTDIYRLYNLVGNESASLITGMVNLSDTIFLETWALVSALLMWIAVPFVTAVLIFHRREV